MKGKVTATSGLLKENLNFEVNYADEDPPWYIRVYVDDFAKDMKYARGGERGYAEGAVFSYTTTLRLGQHTYYFEASDGSLIARFSENGSLEMRVETSRLPFWTIITIALGLGLGTFFFVRRMRRITS